MEILNFIFAAMKVDLARGRAVEFPLGKLKRKKKRFGQRWDDYDDWPANRRRYTVEWELDEAGDKLLNGKKGKPGKG